MTTTTEREHMNETAELSEEALERMDEIVLTRYHVDLNSDGEGTIYIYEDSEVHEVRSDAEDFQEYFNAVQEGKSWAEMGDYGGAVSVVSLSDRITLKGDVLHFDGDPIDTSLTKAIKRYYVEGRDPIGLVNFMTRLYDASESYRLRNFAFQWLTQQRLEVTPEGTLLGYRGVDNNLRARHKNSGAFVNGVWDDGAEGVPNFVGNTITLPRSEVSDDPDVDCGPGLHVGSEDYARSWGPRHLIVEVRPEDIVSVPRVSVNKMRVCSYIVLSEIIPEVETPDFEAPAQPIKDDVLPEQNTDSWRARLLKLIGRR